MNGKLSLVLGIAGLAVVSTGNMLVHADAPDHNETKIGMAQLPAAVAKTLTQEAADGKVGEIDMQIGDNKATYEADVVINKMPYEITIAMDGTLMKKHLSDLDLTMTQLPAPVQATIKQEMGGGTASDIGEHFSDNGHAFYKATLKMGTHAYKVKVLPDGTLLKMKLKEKEHGDHEDGDHDHADKDHGGHGDHGHADGDHGDHADHGNHSDHADHNDQGHGNHGDNN
jgi:hypothetical protein